MWNFFSRKMTDKVGMNVQQTANSTAASSTGALGTAVDRMSFAHDIVMMTDEAIAIGLGADIHVSFTYPQQFENLICSKFIY